jgi:hypothetical protein
MNEDLNKWFKEKWVNIGKKVDGKHPPCGTSGKKSGYAKCVPAAKAAGMSKKEKESATNRKRAAQNKAGRGGKDSAGQGKKPIYVSTKPKNETMNIEERIQLFLEKNCPTDSAKWSASKAAAKKKFDVYPSAYANGWAAKNYKSKGGGWKTCNEGLELNEGPCWTGYKQVGMKMKNGKEVPNCVPNNENINEMKLINLVPLKEFNEAADSAAINQPGGFVGDDGDNHNIDEYDVVNEQDMMDFVKFMKEYNQELNETTCPCLLEGEYQGRDVPLGKPMAGDVKKFKVYVKNPAGRVVKVNFGDPNMRIKKSNPKRRKSFRARHNCANPGPRTKARYWSCRKW